MNECRPLKTGLVRRQDWRVEKRETCISLIQTIPPSVGNVVPAFGVEPLELCGRACCAAIKLRALRGRRAVLIHQTSPSHHSGLPVLQIEDHSRELSISEKKERHRCKVGRRIISYGQHLPISRIAFCFRFLLCRKSNLEMCRFDHFIEGATPINCQPSRICRRGKKHDSRKTKPEHPFAPKRLKARQRYYSQASGTTVARRELP